MGNGRNRIGARQERGYIPAVVVEMYSSNTLSMGFANIGVVRRAFTAFTPRCAFPA